MNITTHNKVGIRFSILLFFLSLLLIIPGAPSHAAPETPQKIVILPFTMHTPKDLLYLQDGIRDMLASRLAWQGKVQVVDRAATLQAAKSIQGDVTQNEAVRIAENLKADHILFGSVTALGQSISIDSKMVPVSSPGEPLSLVAQTQTLDEVIPYINRFAQQINQQVFGRSTGETQSPASEGAAASTRNPELLFTDIMSSDDRISYLNPNFLEMTSEATIRQPGIWRSQTFQGGILGMDVGDVTGDGETEIVTIMRDRVTVLKKQAQGLKIIATYSGTNVDQFMWVAVTDANLDGRAEIYVTNLRRFNESGAAVSESVGGTRGFTERLASLGLHMVNDKLQPIFTDAPYFLNAVEFPGRGRVLIGQEKGRPTDGAFAGSILEMRLAGNSLAPASPVNVPRRCNVFNFAVGDLNNDRSNEIVFVDNSNTLNILSSTGELIWKSDRLFATTTNFFESRLVDRRFNDVELYAIPSPILITDINGDGIPEIVINRSPNTLARFLPNNMKYYDKSEIVSLSWDQLGLVENWKTREISGMVTAIRFADLDNNGKPELVASLVLAKDFLKLWDSRSTIFSYDLNVPAATAQAGQKRNE